MNGMENTSCAERVTCSNESLDSTFDSHSHLIENSVNRSLDANNDNDHDDVKDNNKINKVHSNLQNQRNNILIKKRSRDEEDF